MQEEKVIILRRLKTKDGIISRIEEMPEYRPKVTTICKDRKMSMRVSEHEPPTHKPIDIREYVETKRVHAILIEMEEV